MKTIFITGASGFIGGHLTRVNLEKGNRVRALVLPDDPGRDQLEQSGVELILGDLRDADTVRKGAQGVDIIFHCAAVVTDWAPMRLFEEVTVGGTENVCRAAVASGVSRLVKISTNDVFGLAEDVVMDENSSLKTWGEPYPDYQDQGGGDRMEVSPGRRFACYYGLPLLGLWGRGSDVCSAAVRCYHKG